MDIVELCRRAYDKGLVGGSGGNVSIRTEHGMLITPTGICLGDVASGDLVHVSADGTVLAGHTPSKEWRMHLLCYRREHVQAVVHVHSAFSVGIACLRDVEPDCAMPVYTPGYAVRVGRLPVIPYLRPGSEDLAEAVGRVIATRDSVLLANHGVLAAGTSPTQAFNLIEEIEENAHLHFILGGWGAPLSMAQQRDLAGRY